VARRGQRLGRKRGSGCVSAMGKHLLGQPQVLDELSRARERMYKSCGSRPGPLMQACVIVRPGHVGANTCSATCRKCRSGDVREFSPMLTDVFRTRVAYSMHVRLGIPPRKQRNVLKLRSQCNGSRASASLFQGGAFARGGARRAQLACARRKRCFVKRQIVSADTRTDSHGRV